MEESIHEVSVPLDVENEDPIARAAPALASPDPESEQLENDLDAAIMKIPNEVWVLILSQLTEKELVRSRTVWKKWMEVVDAHFEFSVIVHDGKTNLDRVYDLRIRDCLITRLLCDKDIFQYPNLLRRVRFWGPIHVACFQRIMNTAVSVEELSLTKFALMQENLVGERHLNGFSKIRKLELLGYMCKDESRVVARNASRIFSYNMPDLEKLTVNFHCNIISIHSIAMNLMEFLSRHCNLQNVQVSLVPESTHHNEPAATAASRAASVLVPKSVEDLLRNIKLSMLRITTATIDLPLWNALLNTQSRLQDFRMQLSEGGFLTAQTNYMIGIPFELVREPIIRNASTLISVELKELRLSSAGERGISPVSLDAAVFRYAVNLKRLILYRNIDDFRRYSQYPDRPNIVNLRMLPTTIETLEICRFSCLSEELQFVCDVLENLKNVVLLNTGSLTQLGIHGGIVESISAKTEIQSMNLSPLNYHCSIENKKYETVKLKFGMNDGDHIYYDFERFRKGLPQPRPPVTESSISQTARRSHFQMIDSDFRARSHRCCFEWPMLRRVGSRIRGNMSVVRRRGLDRCCPLKSNPNLKRIKTEPCSEPLASSSSSSSSGTGGNGRSCCGHLLPEDQVPGQCPTDILSRFLLGLDLHFPNLKQYGDGTEPPRFSHRNHHHYERTRRWSGDFTF